MSFGPYCKAVGIDEEVLSGQKTISCEPEKITNGVAWELRKHKISKKLSTKDVVDWFVRILTLKCENDATVQNDLNEKFEKLASQRGTFLKAPKNYPGEVDRLMKWRFDLPQSMGVEPAPAFEPMERANLGPKLLKVLKEKGADVDDSMDLSGPSDDDDEQAKRRKAREEIVQLKKDLGLARKAIMGLNDRLADLSKRCSLLIDVSKTSVSERRRIETDIGKLKSEWNEEIAIWHDCIERLNHANVNKANYLDVGYMVRRNKTKQGIFDELNFEFERTVEEFKHKVNSLLNKERQKKKPVSREYKQKSKSDRKRVRVEGDDEKADDSKRICLSEDAVKEENSMSVDEFLKSECVEEFKNGKFANYLKAIYMDLNTMAIPCKNVHEVVFSVLNALENLNVEKIPAMSFAGNIYMEVRMLAMVQAYSDLIKTSKVRISNDDDTKFNIIGCSYEVSLPNDTRLVLGVRDLTYGSPDTSLNFLKDVFGQMVSMKFDGNAALDQLVQMVKSTVITHSLLDKKYMDIIFIYKQHILPKLKACLDVSPGDVNSKITALNNFCTGLYFLVGLAELADVTVVAWELMSQNSTNLGDSGEVSESSPVLSKTIQTLNNFCRCVGPFEEHSEVAKEFNTFLVKGKKLDSCPLAPSVGNLFNIVFHNSAGVWFFHEVGIFSEFLEKAKEKEMELNSVFDSCSDKQYVAVVRALGLIGKLVAIPVWTMLEDYDVEVGARYATLLKKIESWAKDATKFMKGLEQVFDDIPVSHDAVYISLIKDNDSSHELTKEILELLFTAFIPYIQSFLHGTSKNETTDVNGGMDDEPVMHKNFSKAFDRITKNFHSASTFALDSLMLYSKTRNGEWQDKLCTRSNLKIFELIQKNSNKQLKSLYKRKIRLNEIKEQMEEKKEEFSKCQLIEKRYKLIDDLIKWGGLWKSEKEVDERLKDMKETDRMNALKAQIRFRRHVLGEVNENDLLDLAYDGECFNSSKLYDNLKAVLRNECQLTETDIFELASATDDETLKTQIYDLCKNAQEVEDSIDQGQKYSIKENFYWLLGKKVRQTLTKGGSNETLSGVCIARKKINGVYSYFMRYKERDTVHKFSESKVASDYKTHKLEVVEPSPNELIGSRLSRAFFKDDGDLEWHDCRVIAAASGTEFILEFDYYGSNLHPDPNDENPVPEVETLTFTSCLIEDYRTGRLRFL